MSSSQPLPPLLELTRARLIEYVREPEVIFWVFAFPIIMTIALGIAFRDRPATAVPVGILNATGADALDAALNTDPGLTTRRVDADPRAIERALRDGSVHVVVEPGTPPAYHTDPERPESQVARLMVDAALQRAAGRADVWRAREVHVERVGSRYIDWLVPGLVGMNIMGTGMWGIGFSVTVARNQKLLKRLMATPMRRGHYLMAQMLARLLFLVGELVLVLGFARVAFGVPIAGSVATLTAVAVLGALAFSGLGLLVASRARSIETVSGLMNVTMVPMWLLSGVFFSADNFPAAMQPAIAARPLTALNDSLRGVMLDGSSLMAVGPELGILGAWMVVTFAAALRLFRWQ